MQNSRFPVRLGRSYHHKSIMSGLSGVFASAHHSGVFANSSMYPAEREVVKSDH